MVSRSPGTLVETRIALAKSGSTRHRAAQKGEGSRKKRTVRSTRAHARPRDNQSPPREAQEALDEEREDLLAPAETPAAVILTSRDARDVKPATKKRITSSISGRFTMDTTRAITVGMRVHVLAGTFQGQIGIVKALDGKGTARVALGQLVASVKVDDLAAARTPSTRPALSSSHRKISRPDK